MEITIILYNEFDSEQRRALEIILTVFRPHHEDKWGFSRRQLTFYSGGCKSVEIYVENSVFKIA